MRTIPLRLLVPILALAGGALAVLAVAVARVPVAWTERTALLTVLLGGMLLLVRRSPVHLAPKTKLAVDTAPLFAAALLLPAPLAMVTAAVAVSAADTSRRAPWFQALFNTAETALRVAIGAVVFAALAGTTHLTEPRPGAWLLALPVAAAAMFLLNTLLVDLVIGLQLQRFPLRDYWRRWQFSLPQEGALFLLGLLVATLGVRFPWALVLLAVPAVVVHRSLRDGVALKVQTRAALEELADVLDMRDHYTYEHSRRVAALARMTAEAVGLHPDDVAVVEMAGRVHDVGKIGIKSTVLMKPGQLTAAEWQEMRSHPEVGARLVAKFPEFARGTALVRHHHERYDGTGYPDRLAGARIPLGARVLAVADAWDAMTSHRAYRRALDLERVYTELERGRGTQFDPIVLDAFLRVLAAHPDLATPHPHASQDVDVPLPQPSPA
jgi:HD-GYP domain-containing protein (c-di-GMP phosphodiesterase class II)